MEIIESDEKRRRKVINLKKTKKEKEIQSPFIATIIVYTCML